jgi:hypothetical protein
VRWDSCNDQLAEALIEDLAAKFWEGERGGSIDDRPWPGAGPYWQRIYRHFAERALTVMEQGRHDNNRGAGPAA